MEFVCDGVCYTGSFRSMEEALEAALKAVRKGAKPSSITLVR